MENRNLECLFTMETSLILKNKKDNLGVFYEEYSRQIYGVSCVEY